MSSMTIDQLKKSLTEQGITLPPSRSKKADYLKLYKQYSTMNDSLGDVYSSDDENPPKTGVQNVSSSTSPGKNDNIVKEVEQLTDEELYNQLKEFDSNIGPVLKNTRRVYEKKLIKMLSGISNNISISNKKSSSLEVKSKIENSTPLQEEFSDSDIDSIAQSKKNESKNRKGSLLKESPKPSIPESSKIVTDKYYSSSYEYNARDSTPSYSSESSKTSRFSYIETIPKGSNYSYIEQSPEVSLSNDLRQRFVEKYNSEKYNSEPNISEKYSVDNPSLMGSYKHIDNVDHFKQTLGSHSKFGLSSSSESQFKSGLSTVGQYKPSVGISNRKKSGGTFGEHYIGTWEPNINRYLGGSSQRVTPLNKPKNFAWLKIFYTVLVLSVALFLVVYFYKHWYSLDPYKMIEDDAERTIKQLNEELESY